MAHALHDAGLEPFFDVVYGSSAGAYVGAALVLGDGRGAGPDLPRGHGLPGVRRPAPPRHPAAGGVARPPHRRDHGDRASRCRGSGCATPRVPLRVVATAVDDLTPHVLEPRTVAEWRAAMRATATIPYLAGPAVELHGRRWIDGSVTEPLPLPRALADGATARARPAQPHGAGLRRHDPAGGPGAVDAGAGPASRPGLGAMAQQSHRLAPVLEVLGDPAHPTRAGRHVLAVAPGRGRRGARPHHRPRAGRAGGATRLRRDGRPAASRHAV